MSNSSNPSDNSTLPTETVVQQVLVAFYKKLGEKPDYKEVAERLEKETNNTEVAIRFALFGEDGK
jgi:hypothetical protein